MKRRRGDGGDGDGKPGRSAYDRALGLLARREHSRRELRTRLERGGYAADETEAALDRLGTQQYQDDERFGGMLVRNRVAQGYGPQRIRAELRSHGLDGAAAEALIADAGVDWTASARAQLKRRYGSRRADEPAERARRAQFLLRRGFTAATVRDVTLADVDDAGDEP